MKILIGYSTVFGTSSSYAQKLERQLEKNNLQCICGEIDRYGQEWIRTFNGFLILFLSTTGNGESPANSIQFHKNLKKLKLQNVHLQGLKFAILGFGSTIYPNFCGFAKEIRSLLMNLGAKQIRNIQCFDSNLKENIKSEKKTKDIFEQWKKQIISEINLSRQLLNNDYEGAQTMFSSSITHLIEMKRRKKSSADVEMMSKAKLEDLIEEYNMLPTAKVIEITQLRQKISISSKTCQAPRSTLHIKLQNPSSQLSLSPGCVIYIYPQNTGTTPSLKQNTTHPYSHHQNTDIINQIIKRVKLDQSASRELINEVFNDEECFVLMSREEKLNKYKSCLKNKLLTVGELIEQFQPKSHKFYSKLKLHAPRPYSLCSWNQNQEFIQLCVSIVPNGVASNFFLSNPSSFKFTPSNSVFKIPPTPKPIMMICNGSGIAPFRSIAQYCIEKIIISNGNPLKLYFGIQNQNADYYFKQEWVDYQKRGLVDIKIAESRRNPEEKEYVQNIIEKDVIQEHLFDKNGLIYICGSSGMSKGVKEIIMKTLRSRTKYEDSQLDKHYNELRERSVIVEQIFD